MKNKVTDCIVVSKPDLMAMIRQFKSKIKELDKEKRFAKATIERHYNLTPEVEKAEGIVAANGIKIAKHKTSIRVINEIINNLSTPLEPIVSCAFVKGLHSPPSSLLYISETTEKYIAETKIEIGEEKKGIDMTEFIGTYTADEAKVVVKKIAAKLKEAKK